MLIASVGSVPGNQPVSNEAFLSRCDRWTRGRLSFLIRLFFDLPNLAAQTIKTFTYGLVTGRFSKEASGAAVLAKKTFSDLGSVILAPSEEKWANASISRDLSNIGAILTGNHNLPGDNAPSDSTDRYSNFSKEEIEDSPVLLQDEDLTFNPNLVSSSHDAPSTPSSPQQDDPLFLAEEFETSPRVIDVDTDSVDLSFEISLADLRSDEYQDLLRHQRFEDSFKPPIDFPIRPASAGAILMSRSPVSSGSSSPSVDLRSSNGSSGDTSEIIGSTSPASSLDVGEFDRWGAGDSVNDPYGYDQLLKLNNEESNG